MLLVTNRIPAARSGPLSILSPEPNQSVPFDILIYEVTRRDGAWWLNERVKRTLEESVCRNLKHQVRERGVYSTAALYPAFHAAMKALGDLLGNDQRQPMYLFSQCNGDPAEMFERGRSLEVGTQLEVICFSCPVERRDRPVAIHGLEQARRNDDGALRAG